MLDLVGILGRQVGRGVPLLVANAENFRLVRHHRLYSLSLRFLRYQQVNHVISFGAGQLARFLARGGA